MEFPFGYTAAKQRPGLFIFHIENIERIKSEHPGIKKSDLRKHLSKLYVELPVEERKLYQKRGLPMFTNIKQEKAAKKPRKNNRNKTKQIESIPEPPIKSTESKETQTESSNTFMENLKNEFIPNAVLSYEKYLNVYFDSGKNVSIDSTANHVNETQNNPFLDSQFIEKINYNPYQVVPSLSVNPYQVVTSQPVAVLPQVHPLQPTNVSYPFLSNVNQGVMLMNPSQFQQVQLQNLTVNPALIMMNDFKAPMKRKENSDIYNFIDFDQEVPGN